MDGNNEEKESLLPATSTDDIEDNDNTKEDDEDSSFTTDSFFTLLKETKKWLIGISIVFFVWMLILSSAIVLHIRYLYECHPVKNFNSFAICITVYMMFLYLFDLIITACVYRILYKLKKKKILLKIDDIKKDRINYVNRNLKIKHAKQLQYLKTMGDMISKLQRSQHVVASVKGQKPNIDINEEVLKQKLNDTDWIKLSLNEQTRAPTITFKPHRVFTIVNSISFLSILFFIVLGINTYMDLDSQEEYQTSLCIGIYLWDWVILGLSVLQTLVQLIPIFKLIKKTDKI